MPARIVIRCRARPMADHAMVNDCQCYEDIDRGGNLTRMAHMKD